jgi:uncharacterized protein YkwD
MRLFTRLFGSYCRTRRRSTPLTAAGIVDTLETRVLLAAVNLADEEQLILELINRARANPEAEATRLGISLNAGLSAGTISATPKQPLAPNQQLQNASVAHSTDMVDRDFFAHTNPSGVTPGGRATAAGYDWWTIAENIAYIGYFGSVDVNANSRQAHDLLFRSAGHRTNILMPEVEEIGVGIRSGAFVPSGGNATLVTENFGRRNLNPIITGVVYSDTNNSDFYDIGEAVRAGTITARRVSDGATFSDSIGTSGGYGLIVPAGNYVVTAAFTRNGVPVSMSSSVTVSVDNVKVDFDATEAVTVTLALSSPTVTMSETGTSATMLFTVTRVGSVTGALTVNLNSSDTSELSVPTSVLIPDGQSSANFTVTAAADELIDGTQNALVQASAAGAVSVNRSISVTDTTAPSFTVLDVTTTTLRPTFTWIGVSNAASYEIMVVQITTASTIIHREAGITSTSFTMPIDMPMGTFYIRLRAVTSGRVFSPWGPIQMIRSRPRTTVEGSGRTEASGSFTIRWAAIPGATSYDIVVDRLTLQTRGFLRNGAVPTNSLDVRDFPFGLYQVRVRVLAPGMASDWSLAALVTVSVPTTSIEGSGRTEPSGTFTIRWAAIPGATSYDIVVDRLTSQTRGFLRNGAVPTNSLDVRDFPLGLYQVRVRVLAPGMASDWSLAALVTVSVPTTSIEGSGRTETSGTFTIRWAAIPGATSYDIVVDRLTSQAWSYLRNGAVPTNSLVVSDFPIGLYQVRVRVLAPGMASVWSVAALVTVSVPTTGVRVDAADIGSLATLTWEAVNGAVRYDVQVDNQTTGVSQVIRNVNVAGTSLAMPTLTPGSYTAVVRAIDSANRTHLSSAPFAFVFNAPTQLTYAATALAGQPLFSWITVAGAVRYELVFANTSLVPQLTLSSLTGNQYQPSVPLVAGAWRAWIRAFDSGDNATSISNIVAFDVA